MAVDDAEAERRREALLEQFVSNQAKELELRTNEQRQKLKADEYDHDYAVKALDAQLTDRERERVHQREQEKVRRGFAGLIILLVVGFSVYCVHVGKSDLAAEVVKLAASAVLGAFGGYGYAKSKKEEKAKGDG